MASILYVFSNYDRAQLNAVRVVFEHLTQRDDLDMLEQFKARLASVARGDELPRSALPTALWGCELTATDTIRHSSVRELKADGSATLHILELGSHAEHGIFMYEESSIRRGIEVYLTAHLGINDPYNRAAKKAVSMYRFLTGRALTL